MARGFKVDLNRHLRGRAMTAICAFLPSRRRTSRSAVAQRRLHFPFVYRGPGASERLRACRRPKPRQW
jgi:hypothetical protein